MRFDIDTMAEHSRLALLRVVVELFALAGFAPGGSVETVPRHLRLLVMRGLRCAEAATRRIIMVFERRLEPLESETQARSDRPKSKSRKSGKRLSRAFVLIDPKRGRSSSGRKHPPGLGPQIRSLGYDWEPAPEPAKPAPMPDDEMSAESLRQRLEALLKALNDPMAQARRLQKLRARAKTPAPVWPMRYGTPPGHKKEPKNGYKHEVERVLHECHKLAHRALVAPDTS